MKRTESNATTELDDLRGRQKRWLAAIQALSVFKVPSSIAFERLPDDPCEAEAALRDAADEYLADESDYLDRLADVGRCSLARRIIDEVALQSAAQAAAIHRLGVWASQRSEEAKADQPTDDQLNRVSAGGILLLMADAAEQLIDAD